MTDFATQSRIYYHDTDSGGVVYYARYLEHLEEGRAELFRSKGVDLAAYGDKGVLFPVVHIEADYRAPARYGDTVTILTRVEAIGNSSIHFLQQILREEKLLVTAKTVWACVDREMVSRRVPDEVRKLFPAK